MSKLFQFDTQLVSSAVYQRAVRSLFKRPNPKSEKVRFEPAGPTMTVSSTDLEKKKQAVISGNFDISLRGPAGEKIIDCIISEDIDTSLRAQVREKIDC